VRRNDIDNAKSMDNNDDILMPSASFFQRIHKEAPLKENVKLNIYNRESLLESLRQIIEEGKRNGNNYSVNEDNSTRSEEHEIKPLLFSLHHAALSVIESIIATHQLSNNWRKGNDSEWRRNSNYVIKMLTDVGFIQQHSSALDYLGIFFEDLDEKRKTTHRNPFLLPLNIDEVSEYCPRQMDARNKLFTMKMHRIPWEVDIDRIKNATSWILSEEKKHFILMFNSFEKLRISTAKSSTDIIDIGKLHEVYGVSLIESDPDKNNK